MKKETTISLLKEIRDILRSQTGYMLNNQPLTGENNVNPISAPIKKTESIFTPVTTIKVKGAKGFCLKGQLKYFNIGWIGENFKKNFLDKEETDIPDATLSIQKLVRDSFDKDILAELGDKAETKLVYVFNLIKNQLNGNAGPLLTNGNSNVFYIRNKNNELWVVNVYWNSDYGYWGVGADPIEDPYCWDAGSQVVSCDS